MSGPENGRSPGPVMETHIPRRAWLALGVSTLVTFFVVIDISAINVAFPSIERYLDTDRSTLSWMISGYNVTVGALLLAAGRVADSIGRRKVFIPGVALFMVGSALCGLAPTVEFLIAARIVQGFGGAVVTASSFAVMLPEFPPARRSTAIGFAGATGSLGAVVGPALGSLVIDAFNWRAIFWINVPLSLLVIVLAPRLLSESSDPNATGRIDIVGVVIGTAAVALVMFGIIQSEQWSVADLRVIGLVVVGTALFPLLVKRSRQHPEPLLDLELFSHRSFSAASAGAALYGFAFISGSLTNSIMLQDLWQQELRTVGLVFVPASLLGAIVSPLIGSIADRVGHRWVLGFGCLLLSLSYVLLIVVIDHDPAVWNVYMPLTLLTGAGIGVTVATWSSAAMADIPPAKFGVAGATANTIRQASTAVGISVVITLLATGAHDFDLGAYQRAWMWIAGCYLLAAIVVMATFPAGNSSDRAL